MNLPAYVPSTSAKPPRSNSVNYEDLGQLGQHEPGTEQWSKSSGSNVIPRWARPEWLQRHPEVGSFWPSWPRSLYQLSTASGHTCPRTSHRKARTLPGQTLVVPFGKILG